MSEKETLGMNEVKETKELTAAEKAKKKKAKYTLAKIIVALCVVLCIVLTVFEMGFTYRTLKAVEIDDTQYSVAEYNWFYTTTVYDTYNTLYQTYGQYASYFFNPQASLGDQQYSEDQTWADHIRDLTDASMVEMTALGKAAEAAGYVLPEEYAEIIENEWDALEAAAKSYGYSVGDYCELSYGRGVNEKVFREMYEKYYYAMSYSADHREGLVVTDDEIDAYYAENAENFDSVTYKSFFATGAASEGKDEATAMAEAKERAEKILSGEDEEATLNEYKYAIKANIDELYRDWLFDSARVAGDKEIFEAENGYYVVEFVEITDLHYNTVDVRHILVSVASADTDEAKENADKEAKEKAESYKAEFEKDPTEENFAELAEKYSVDNAENGGLYEKVFKGQMVTEFEDWCFDAARKPGDCDIVKTDYGYHVMYYVGENVEYYTYTVDNAIRAERSNDYLDEIIGETEAVPAMGYSFTAKHYK